MDRTENASILVVDDDHDIVNAIAMLLEKEGYRIYKAYNGLEALDAVTMYDIQLILIDVMMPKLDGLSAMMRIREKKNIPIIVLSAKSEDSDKILGLSMGADDYITKPYNPAELAARVRASLRRYLSLGAADSAVRSDTVKVGGLVLDKAARQLYADGEPVRLTATEYKITELLMENAGRVFSAEEIYSRVWNEDSFSVENTVMVHIRHIREKIEINPGDPRYLKVVWGIGYKIEKL
ncbi:MAG: response regulator transcription factor [Ruminococcus sp.]|nr:response regulator transcription factor [Ruminococcus sp.]